MSKLFTTNVKGFTKEEALSQVELELGFNATQAWKKADCPTYGTEDFITFCQNYLKEKKVIAGGGCYIQKTACQKDTRVRPYKIVNFKKEGRTKWETKYNIHEAELVLDKEGKFKEIAEIGKVVSSDANNKAEAETLMKDLIANNKRHYVVRKSKEVVEADDSKNAEVLCVGVYTPSISAKQGEFYVFGLVKE